MFPGIDDDQISAIAAAVASATNQMTADTAPRREEESS
jgi:hypothetical protein